MSDFCFLARYSRKRRYLNSKVPHRCCLSALTAYHSVIYDTGAPGVFSRLCSLMREGRVDTKKPLFPKFSRGRTPPPPSGAVEYFGYHTQTLGYCFLSWTGKLCAPAVTR